MTTNGIFPTQDDERNVYYNRTIPYINVLANQTRLAIDAAKATVLTTNLTDWNDVYPKAKDKNLSTKTLRDQKNGLIVTIEDGLREIYDDIPESALTNADRNTLNLKKRDTINTPRPAIGSSPIVKANSLNGARIELIVRTDSDSTRASKLKEADGIEVAFSIGGTQPVSPKDCNKNFFSTKAKFKIELDIADAGKKFNGFVRWKNNTDPAKSGPWTKLVSASISD